MGKDKPVQDVETIDQTSFRKWSASFVRAIIVQWNRTYFVHALPSVDVQMALLPREPAKHCLNITKYQATVALHCYVPDFAMTPLHTQDTNAVF